jgi:cytochrome c oxidase subunit I
MWGGKISIKTPMLFAIGFVAMFIIGGLSGVALAIVPIDQQVTQTYFVVAHLHYVLFGGTVLGVFSGIFYWFPKMTGRLLSEKLGKWQFWIMLIGFNMTFFPMHILGMDGMPRRIYTYVNNPGWAFLNSFETLGAFIIAISMLIFIWNVFKSLRSGEAAGEDPWDGSTLEWATSSPPPAYDFAKIPAVTSLRPLWDQKHPPKNSHNVIPNTGGPAETKNNEPAEVIHLPGRSHNPILIAFGVTVGAYAAIYALWLLPLGVAIVLTGIVLWNWETP